MDDGDVRRIDVGARTASAAELPLGTVAIRDSRTPPSISTCRTASEMAMNRETPWVYLNRLTFQGERSRP